MLSTPPFAELANEQAEAAFHVEAGMSYETETNSLIDVTNLEKDNFPDVKKFLGFEFYHKNE